MSATYAIPMTGLIPREFSFEDTARIMINDEMLNIIVLMYSESHVDNVEVSNMLSDSVSMYAYGAMPISIALSGLVKESKDGNHLYSVLKKYKTEWRQRLLTDYKKNTKLTIMDVVMDFAITSINIVKNTDIMGYDTINIDGIGWNYTMPQDNLFKYNDGFEGEAPAATGDTSTTNTTAASSTATAATSSGSSTENSTGATQSAQDLNTQTEKEEKKSEEQTPTKTLYKKEDEQPASDKQEAKIETYTEDDNYKLLDEKYNISGSIRDKTGTASVTRTYILNGQKVTKTTTCTKQDLLRYAAQEDELADAETSKEKVSILRKYNNDWQIEMQCSHGITIDEPATGADVADCLKITNAAFDKRFERAKKRIYQRQKQIREAGGQIIHKVGK